jgi:hypothetical protein
MGWKSDKYLTAAKVSKNMGGLNKLWFIFFFTTEGTERLGVFFSLCFSVVYYFFTTEGTERLGDFFELLCVCKRY